MAKRLNSETAGNIGHNQLSPAERDALIASVIAEKIAIAEERKELNAKLSRRTKTNHAIVRGQLGYSVKVFDDEFFRPKIEQDNEEDGEAWDMRLQAKAEAARFLKIGEQTELFGSQAKKQTRAARAKDQRTSAEDEEAASEDIADSAKQAGVKGYEAGEGGVNFADNPYPAGSKQHQSWAKNWKEAQKKMAQNIKGPAEAPAVH